MNIHDIPADPNCTVMATVQVSGREMIVAVPMPSCLTFGLVGDKDDPGESALEIVVRPAGLDPDGPKVATRVIMGREMALGLVVALQSCCDKAGWTGGTPARIQLIQDEEN